MSPAPELKSTLNLPQTAFPMKANLPQNEPLRLAEWAAIAPLRTVPRSLRRAAPLHPPRRPSLRQRSHPPRPRPEQVHQGLRRQDQDHGRLRRPLRPRLGLPRPAHRDQSRRAARPQKARDGPHRRPPSLPRLRAEIRRPPAHPVRAHRRLRPLGQALPHHVLRLRGPHRSRPSTTSSRRASSTKASSPSTGASTTAPPSPKPKSSTSSTPAPASTSATSSPATRCDRRRASPAARSTPSSGPPPPGPSPHRMAVAFNPELEYVALDDRDGIYIVAEALLSAVIVRCNLMSVQEPHRARIASRHRRRFTGTQLERATFQHPFLDRSILGVTRRLRHRRPGHRRRPHRARPRRRRLRHRQALQPRPSPVRRQRRPPAQHRRLGVAHAHPYEGLTVFKSNPVIIDLLKEKGALLSATTSSTPTRTAGAATTPSSSAPPSSGSSAWKPR